MSRPSADITVSQAVVSALLAQQHPDLADLPLTWVGEGWDNALYRLGTDLVVRVPRRVSAASLVLHEQRWLPVLAPSLPIPVPAPVRVGRASQEYPWAWSVCPWFDGVSAHESLRDGTFDASRQLASFLRALHAPAPEDAPPNPWRGGSLVGRDARFATHLAHVEGLVDVDVLRHRWRRALEAPAWAGAPVWIHGDLHPLNIIVNDGRIAAVVDWGDLTSGDPATDLSVAWMWGSPQACKELRQLACGPTGWVDDATWLRARGWALALGLAYVNGAGAESSMGQLGLHTIEAALSDDR